MVKRGVFLAFKHGGFFPQHFEVASRKPCGKRLSFEGENAQEKPRKVNLHIRIIPIPEGQITRILSESYKEFVSLPFSKLRHLCRFEKGGYCKKIRRNAKPKNAQKQNKNH